MRAVASSGVQAGLASPMMTAWSPSAARSAKANLEFERVVPLIVLGRPGFDIKRHKLLIHMGRAQNLPLQEVQLGVLCRLGRRQAAWPVQRQSSWAVGRG